MICPAPDPVVGLVLAVVLLALAVVYAAIVTVIVRRLRAGPAGPAVPAERAGGDTTTGAAGVARSWRGASAAPQTRPVQGREEAGRVAASRPVSPRHAAEPPDASLLWRAQDAARGIPRDLDSSMGP